LGRIFAKHEISIHRSLPFYAVTIYICLRVF
jgi:hypothetical protein